MSNTKKEKENKKKKRENNRSNHIGTKLIEKEELYSNTVGLSAALHIHVTQHAIHNIQQIVTEKGKTTQYADLIFGNVKYCMSGTSASLQKKRL